MTALRTPGDLDNLNDTYRSQQMLLIHEDLARARIDQRLNEADAVRTVRIAHVRRARYKQGRTARLALRVRLLVAYGSTR